MVLVQALVTMGELGTADKETELSCLGVGSGIVLAVYDAVNQIGACAHFILPSAPSVFDRSKPCRYADCGFDETIRKVLELGGERANLHLAIVGGASLVSGEQAGAFHDFGTRNAEAIMAKVAKSGIPCVGQDLGGQSGRAIRFSGSDGSLRVRTGPQAERLLCKLRGR